RQPGRHRFQAAQPEAFAARGEHKRVHLTQELQQPLLVHEAADELNPTIVHGIGWSGGGTFQEQADRLGHGKPVPQGTEKDVDSLPRREVAKCPESEAIPARSYQSGELLLIDSEVKHLDGDANATLAKALHVLPAGDIL